MGCNTSIPIEEPLDIPPVTPYPCHKCEQLTTRWQPGWVDTSQISYECDECNDKSRLNFSQT